MSDYDRNPDPIPCRASGLVQPCAAANPAIALRLQSTRPVGRVAELGSLACTAPGSTRSGLDQFGCPS
jgi:hypothetical protein